MHNISFIKTRKAVVFFFIILNSFIFFSLNSCDNNSRNTNYKINKYLPEIDYTLVDDTTYNKNNRTLIKESISDIESDSVTAATVAKLSVVINRYYTSPLDPEIRKNAMEAFRLLANINMSYDIDYRKAYKYLSEAKQIAEEDDDDHNLSLLYVSLVNLYHMNDNETTGFRNHVNKLLNEGIDASIKSANDTALTCLAVDMALFNDNETGWGEFEPLAEKIRNYKFIVPSPYSHITNDIIRGFDYYYKDDYNNAETTFISAAKEVDDLRYGERFLFPIRTFLMKVYRAEGDWEKEAAIGKELLAIARDKGYVDYELWMNKSLSDMYKSIGKNDSSEFYHTNYLLLEETMKRENGYEAVKTMDFVSEIERINNEVQTLSFKKKEQERQQVVLFFILVILLIIIAALVWRFLNLKKNHRDLFKKNGEMIKREEQHKIIREQWTQEKQKLLEELAAKKESQKSDPENQQSNNDNTCEKNELTPLYARILEVMESSDKIFQSGFSLDELANILKMPSRVVSRAINLCHRANFHQLLTEYRIREASRRMHDPKSDNLTIESIAESVGFKSRTSFASLFKKVIGLTPSEYWKIARSGGTVEIPIKISN